VAKRRAAHISKMKPSKGPTGRSCVIQKSSDTCGTRNSGSMSPSTCSHIYYLSPSLSKFCGEDETCRLAVTVVALVVIVGILTGAWMQVEEEHSSTELAYPTTYTYSRPYTSTYNYAQTEPSTVLEATNVHLPGKNRPDANKWMSNWFQLTEGETIIVGLGVTPWRSYHAYFDVWRRADELCYLICPVASGTKLSRLSIFGLSSTPFEHSEVCATT